MNCAISCGSVVSLLPGIDLVRLCDLCPSMEKKGIKHLLAIAVKCSQLVLCIAATQNKNKTLSQRRKNPSQKTSLRLK